MGRQLRLHGLVGDDEELPRLQAVAGRREDQCLNEDGPHVIRDPSSWVELLGGVAPLELGQDNFGGSGSHLSSLAAGVNFFHRSVSQAFPSRVPICSTHPTSAANQ